MIFIFFRTEKFLFYFVVSLTIFNFYNFLNCNYSVNRTQEKKTRNNQFLKATRKWGHVIMRLTMLIDSKLVHKIFFLSLCLLPPLFYHLYFYFIIFFFLKIFLFWHLLVKLFSSNLQNWAKWEQNVILFLIFHFFPHFGHKLIGSFDNNEFEKKLFKKIFKKKSARKRLET